MNESNRWRVIDKLQTEEERGKEEKNGGDLGDIYRPGCQRPDV